LNKRSRNCLSQSLPAQSSCRALKSYDIVGDIAIIHLSEVSAAHGVEVADAIMRVHKNVKTVLAQIGAVHGDFRLRQLSLAAGENKTVTAYSEWGCVFLGDVGKCYFSPRLSYERMRIAKQVGKGEVVLNMFAGVGCFSILIARYSNADRVYSVDINPSAVQYMRENVRLNTVCGKVFCLLGDAQEIVRKSLRYTADRVLMPLPEKALEYLPYALLALKKTGGWINYYDFGYGDGKEEAIEKVKLKVSEKLQGLGVAFDIKFGRIVRATGPHWYQVVLDIEVSGVANGKSRLNERVL
jgi:tRNA (guanine37-N1)-methyltransferase